MSKTKQLTSEQIDDLLYCARAGETDDMMAYIDELVPSTTISAADKDADRLAVLEQVLDASGNGMIHYACANGHLATLKLLLPFTRLTTLLHQNNSGNTPLHWAGLNGHLETVKALLSHIESLEQTPFQREEAIQLRELNRRRDEDARHRRKQKESSKAEGEEGAGSEQQQQQQRNEQEQHRSIWDVKNNFGRGPTSESQLNDQEAVVQFLLTAMAGSEAQQQTDKKVEEKPRSDADEEQISQKTSELNVADQQQ